MKSKFIRNQHIIIDQATDKIAIATTINVLLDVTVADIVLGVGELVERQFHLDIGNSTPKALKKILSSLDIQKISVHTSSVIGATSTHNGVYLLIFTELGIFRLIGRNLQLFAAGVIKQGKWSKRLSRYEPLGTWDYISYQGGNRKYIPKGKYSTEELLNQLTPLFIK